jgi:CRISPR-associated protein Csm3
MPGKPLLGKVIFSGTIRCRTGLHIGGSEAELAIGGIDSYVIKDPLTRQPYIPGSSLKGKMRSLMERFLGKDFNRRGGAGIFRHECNDSDCPVCRLFGATKGGQDGENMPARILVRDAFLTEQSAALLQEMELGLGYTEWKTENGLDRVTCHAMPRTLERVPAGAVFGFEIVYNVENQGHLVEDIGNILNALHLVEDDYIGKGGTRGNGRIDISLEAVEARTSDHYRAGAEARVLKVPADWKEKSKALPSDIARQFGK